MEICWKACDLTWQLTDGTMRVYTATLIFDYRLQFYATKQKGCDTECLVAIGSIKVYYIVFDALSVNDDIFKMGVNNKQNTNLAT